MNIIRTNQRNHVNFMLATKNGVPCCPHCNAEMVEMSDCYHNSQCGCWWVGANDGIYPLQVVVATTDELQVAYLEAGAKAAAERLLKEQAENDSYPALSDEKKFALIQERRGLWGKKRKAHRAKVRAAIAAGADFKTAMKA